jgi:hypothetical protein
MNKAFCINLLVNYLSRLINGGDISASGHSCGRIITSKIYEKKTISENLLSIGSSSE